MNELVWVFARGDERLTIRRRQTEDGLMLVIDDGTSPRSCAFKDDIALITFQSNMEGMLLQTGWLLEAFEPDQRKYHDRRAWPRLATDRRRWWTDGQSATRKNWLLKGATWLSDRMTSRPG